MDSKQQYKVIGLMSGTSLDGVDIAFCTFINKNNRWSFEMKNVQTIPYPKKWHDKLQFAPTLSGQDLIHLHEQYGAYLGTLCKTFIEKNKIKADFIASHGHTVFHNPSKHYTFQLGSGNALHASCSLPVVFDFRSLDVARGGEGAPLVPIGDQLLFNDYTFCLNLGGIANLSTQQKKSRVAFDICFLNMGLNYLANQRNKKYDKNGEFAASGNVDKKLFTQLTKFYSSKTKPSLSREMFEKKVIPLLDSSSCSTEDKLNTLVEAAAQEIARQLKKINPKGGTVLCTGGGAYNSYLMYRLIEHCGDAFDLILPEDSIIQFKEALIFAFLGVLRVRNEINVMNYVTHASQNSCAGLIIGKV